MTSETVHHRGKIQERAAREAKRYLVLFAYFVVFFGSFSTYRRLVLAEMHINYAEYGWAIIKALVLAKVVLIGEVFHVGERYEHRPLIVSTLWKTLMFALLISAFGVVERLVEAPLHHRPLSEEFQLFAGTQKYEFFARIELQTLALVPLFAFRELARVLGEGKLAELFFHSTPPLQPTMQH
jgi:hypothetical protein